MTNTDLQSINEEIASNISRQVSAQVEKTISTEVESGVEAARGGMRRVKTADGKTENQGITGIGFIDAIIGFIFRFLEMIGLDKTVAGWMGNPIPEQQEVKNISSVVGKAVGNSIKNSKAQDKEGFERDMAAQLKQSLFNAENRSRYASFTDEQLNEIANKTAAQTTQTLSGMFDENGKIKNDGQNPIIAQAQQQTYQVINVELANPDTRKQFARAIGKDDISQSDMMVFATAIGPTMAVLETNRPVSAQAAAKRIYDDLSKNRSTIEATTGAKLTDNMIAAAAYGLADRYADSKGIPKDGDFRKNVARTLTAATGDVIARETADIANKAIAESTAIGVRNTYENSMNSMTDFSAWGFDAQNKRDLAIFDKYYDKTSNPDEPYKRNSLPDANGELAAAIERLNKFAAEGNSKPVVGLLTGDKALSDEQRELVSKIIGEETAKTVTNAQKPFENQQELAAALKANVEKALRERSAEIDKLGTPIATINANLSEKNKPFDMITSISGGIAEKMGKPESKETFAQIQRAQALVQGARKGAAVASVGSSGVNGNGISGGLEVANAQAQANLGLTARNASAAIT